MKAIHLIAPSGASLDIKSPLAAMEWLKSQGIQIVAGNPETLRDFIGKQIAVWGKFVIENNIKETQ